MPATAAGFQKPARDYTLTPPPGRLKADAAHFWYFRSRGSIYEDRYSWGSREKVSPNQIAAV